MDPMAPHYLLFSRVDSANGTGRWRFVLRSQDGQERFEAADYEPGIRGERLDLLTVVRALESLDQPSRVTLVGCSDYLWKGVRHGLDEWKTNGWRWEFFGQMVPVRNSDLWQRLDRALRFHEVQCRRRRLDPAHRPLHGPIGAQARKKSVWGLREKLSNWLKYAVSVIQTPARRCVCEPRLRWRAFTN
jgi:ribonuclease HI